MKANGRKLCAVLSASILAFGILYFGSLEARAAGSAAEIASSSVQAIDKTSTYSGGSRMSFAGSLMASEGDLSLNVDMNVNFDCSGEVVRTDPKATHLGIGLGFTSAALPLVNFQENLEMYAKSEGSKVTMYACGTNNGWTRQTKDESIYNYFGDPFNFTFIRQIASGAVPAQSLGEASGISGHDTYVLQATVSGSSFKSAMDMAFIGGLMSELYEVDVNSSGIVTLYVDKNTYLPVYMTIDTPEFGKQFMAEMTGLGSANGVDATVNGCTIVMQYTGFDEFSTITIPAEALAAAG